MLYVFICIENNGVYTRATGWNFKCQARERERRGPQAHAEIEKRCCDAKLFDFIIFSANKIVKMSEATCFMPLYVHDNSGFLVEKYQFCVPAQTPILKYCCKFGYTHYSANILHFFLLILHPKDCCHDEIEVLTRTVHSLLYGMHGVYVLY